MTKNYTFSEIAKQYNRSHAFVHFQYKKAIRLFDLNKIEENIKDFVFEGKIYGGYNKRYYNTKIVSQHNLPKFKEIIDKARNTDLRLEPIMKAKTDNSFFWREDNIYCYSIGYQCHKCNIAKMYPNLMKECRLFIATKQLVDKLGVPRSLK